MSATANLHDRPAPTLPACRSGHASTLNFTYLDSAEALYVSPSLRPPEDG